MTDEAPQTTHRGPVLYRVHVSRKAGIGTIILESDDPIVRPPADQQMDFEAPGGQRISGHPESMTTNVVFRGGRIEIITFVQFM